MDMNPFKPLIQNFSEVYGKIVPQKKALYKFYLKFRLAKATT